jgi:hypothetical protein
MNPIRLMIAKLCREIFVLLQNVSDDYHSQKCIVITNKLIITY